MVRLTSDFWVSALIRKVEGAGGFAYLARRGAGVAGAIFVRVSGCSGRSDLYAPAPQASYDDEADGERRFQRILHEADDLAIGERMEREIRFDPDLWLVELENIGATAEFLALAPEN